MVELGFGEKQPRKNQKNFGAPLKVKPWVKVPRRRKRFFGSNPNLDLR